MHHLFFASRNAHKTHELSQILGPDFTLEDLRDHPEIGEVLEVGATFLENAQLKAATVSQQIPGLVLADDSGLEVDSLGGAPGIYSARYAGTDKSDAANRRKLLAELDRLPSTASRAARFRCVLVLAEDGRALASFEGVAAGKILRAERGAGGFGYDPLFQPDGYEESFAELSSAEKNAISHRSEAAAHLRSFFERTPNAPSR